MVSLLLILEACGISKPIYKPYDTNAEDDTLSPAKLAAFDKDMASIKTNCAVSGCHLSISIGGVKLSATDSAINRKAIIAYTGTTSTKLDLKLRSGTHGGGKQTSPTKVQIDDWLAAENTK
jgi:hypothetical protein